MDFQLAGEVAVVIGGARGIGRAVAEEFAQQQAMVAIVDINPAAVQAAEEIADRYQVRATSVVVDVSDYEAMQEAANKVQVELGRCDHVVYTAAIGSGKYGYPFWKLEPSDWPRVIEVNLLGAVHTAHAFAPAMVEARYGTFLFFTSVAGQIGSQTDPPYSAAKAAIINFAHCAARDLAEYNVRVNLLSPGMVKSALNQSVWQSWNDRQPEAERRTYEDWAEEKIRTISLLGRWQEPADLAAAAVFLASHRASNITGQTLNVDGGQVLHS
jgi:NAD(P)-dependent dehydrogenase (short-subunit alcohol dehydrogenase family)